MPAPNPSDEVAAYLDALYEAYDGFDVSQTTVSVGPAEFSAVEARGDVAEVRVRVEGAEGVLAVRDDEDDEWVVPGGVVDGDGTRLLSAAARRLVRDQTGVTCDVEDLHRVAIACVQCEDSGDEVWEFTVVFAGRPTSGAPAVDATWRERLSEPPAAF